MTADSPTPIPRALEGERPVGHDGSRASVRSLSVLISTHNRIDLLMRALRYLNEAQRPPQWTIDVLVVANACSDGTHAFLESRASGDCASKSVSGLPSLPLRWIAEPEIGKSHALNRAIPEIASELVAFVDDDHRVDSSYLQAVCEAATAYPDAEILCGRILPDWDGSEPDWVHDMDMYRIYPLPVPRYDLGDAPMASPEDTAIPGGGNLIVRTHLFQHVGGFSTDFGPKGHNLAGGEDQEWVRRALALGARAHYVPQIVQYHYVDPDRLKLAYLVRKAYERSASVARMSDAPLRSSFVPRFLFRKVVQHSLLAATSLSQRRRRFHLVRTAASLGEIKGHLQGRADLKSRLKRPQP